jgi:prefoldin alpha subunit
MSASRRPSRSAEEQLQEEAMRLEAYRSQLSSALQQHQLLLASRSDHLRAQEALEGLDRTLPDSEILIPIGGETYLRGNPDRKGPVLLGIGNGYVIEIERPKAVERIAQRTNQIEQAVRELESQIRPLEERIQLVSRRIDMLTGRVPASAPERSDVGGD